jgi:putative ABC transport system substrate-binding protein
MRPAICHPRSGGSMIARRGFAALLGASAVAPCAILAQQPAKVRRVGFLTLDTADSTAGRQAVEQFPAALAKRGFRMGSDLVMEWRWADGRGDRLPELAADLVRARVDVIVARTNDPIHAAMAATPSIPIVMLNGNFPVETGLVQSLSRPGGNVTGTAYISPQTLAKQMQLLKEIAPRARRVAVLWAVSASGYEQVIRGSLDRAADSLGMGIQYFDVHRPDDIAPTLEDIASSKCDGLWFSGSSILRTRMPLIVAALIKRRLPSVAGVPAFAEQGGLAHYAPDIEEFYERTAGYVDRVLKGAKPATLPVDQPTKYELAVNLETARAIGITIPAAVLARADRVIG